jgi:hypothetical protein
MKPLHVILFLALSGLGVFAQGTPDIQSRENRLSIGVSTGMLSGVAGISARYWMDRWGIQATALPVVDFNSGGERVVLGGLQIMRRINQEPPRLHESSGYVHSLAYNYLGVSLADLKKESDSAYRANFIGGGFGLETFWRNWRFSSGVGIVLVQNPDDELLVLPSLDLNLSMGI